MHSSASQSVAAVTAERRAIIPRRRLTAGRASFLLMLPSFAAITIFVYAFLLVTFYVSLSNWRSLKIDLTLREPLWGTYAQMFAMPRFQADLRNTVVFTILFIALAILIGLTLAILLDRKIVGRSVFRSIFLFPYALSLVVTGVAWRWIFNPETGVNLLFEVVGLNAVLTQFGMEPLKPGWITNPDVMFQLNTIIAMIWPAAGFMQLKLGIPAAMIPVTIAASWQLSGFVMAMYMGGMAAIPEEIRRAARVDGAGEWKLYRRIIIPMLKPVTFTVVVILLHVSLKIFDLVFTMSGVGPGFATDVPAIFVFEMMFRATRYNLGSAASIVMLVLVSLVIVPYLIKTLREESR